MFHFLITSNIFVAFAAASLYIYYSFVLEKNFFLSTPLLVFSGTYIAYNFLRVISLYRLKDKNSRLSKWYTNYKGFLIIPHLFAGMLFILGLLDLTPFQMTLIIIAGIIVLFYERSFGSYWSLRLLPYTKPFVISICWSLVTVGLHFESLNLEFALSFIDCFLFISLLCLLFDLKDTEIDKIDSIKSITHLKDLRLAYLFAVTHALVYLAYLSWNFNFSYEYYYTFGLFLLILASLRSMKRPILFAFITDGAIIFKALLGIYLLKH